MPPLLAASRFILQHTAAKGLTKLPIQICSSLFHSSSRRSIVFKSPFNDIELSGASIPEYMLELSTGPISKYGDNVAFYRGSEIVTYNQHKRNVLSFAQTLQERYAIKRDTVIGVLLPNSPEFAVSVHGGMAAGGIISPINPQSTAWELGYQLEDSGATMMVTSANHLDTVIEANNQAGSPLKAIIVAGEDANNSTIPHITHPLCYSYQSMLDNDGSNWKEVIMDGYKDTALIPYSSGTTGRPKGVLLTHSNVVNNIKQECVEALSPPNSSSRLLGLLPFYHSYGFTVLLNLALHAGASITCLPKFDPVTFLTLVQNNKLDVLHVVPPIALFLAKSPLVDQFDLSSVKQIVCAAAPLSKEVTDMIYERLKWVHIVRQGYGLTELSPLSHLDLGHKTGCQSGSAGVLVPNTMCKVTCLVTGKELGPYENGEICIKGPQVMKGYHNNPTATNSTIDAAGWLHTGDIGHVDNNGHLYIQDRVKELIKVKANQVAPAELEGILLGHSQVLDACVVQKPDERCGEVPKGYVILKHGATVTAEELRNWVNQHLSKYKHLVDIEFID
eukprot:Ihof_evm2s12 gene=Ihof_evmTU2s12